MMYNRRIWTPDGEDWFTVLELIYRHYDYKKGMFSMMKYMTDDSFREREHRKRLYNFRQQIDDWRNRAGWKGESESIVTRFLKEEWLKEE